jgi:AcrR family transcriptional regulator
MSSRVTSRAPSAHTRNQIKAAAQTLFARQAIDGVTVQQIVAAAGQRNNAALHYHFGSKEELIRQLVVDGALVLENKRQGMLQDINARGGPSSIREIILVLVMPVVELSNDERWNGYIRFTSNLQASDPEKLRAALNSRWNASYMKCFAYLKQMLPLPPEIVEQRLSIFAIYANAILSAREAAIEMRRSKRSRLWDKKFTTENILDTLEATLTVAPSVPTIEAMEQSADNS